MAVLEAQTAVTIGVGLGIALQEVAQGQSQMAGEPQLLAAVQDHVRVPVPSMAAFAALRAREGQAVIPPSRHQS